MNRYIILSLSLMAICLGAKAYEYEDDIYYNPKKTDTSKKMQSQTTRQPQLVDFNTIDVDEYNRRGNYFYTEIDTIGTGIQNEPDFQYTTQIQKFYNPTIVTDNAAILKDVLNNSYGNIEIVYNYDGTPSFVPWSIYSWPSYWAYNSWYNPWGWSVGFGPFSIRWNSWWGWGPSWSWSWGWGPSWGWGGPGWGWGPSWGWTGPAWRPGFGYMADYRPGGRAPFGNVAHRPGVGNFNGRPQNGHLAAGNRSTGRGQFRAPTIQHGNSVRPSGNMTSRPSGNVTSRPAGNITSRPASDLTNRPVGNLTSRPAGNVTSRPANGVVNTPAGNINTRPGNNPSTRPAVTNKPSQSTNSRPSTIQTQPAQRQQTTRPSTNTNTNRGSFGGNRGGSFGGGGRSSGGFGGGSHGGGGRGGRR